MAIPGAVIGIRRETGGEELGPSYLLEARSCTPSPSLGGKSKAMHGESELCARGIEHCSARDRVAECRGANLPRLDSPLDYRFA